MPLPDESPRPSVANLIGRFEQQGKRTSNIGTTLQPVVQIPGKAKPLVERKASLGPDVGLGLMGGRSPSVSPQPSEVALTSPSASPGPVPPIEIEPVDKLDTTSGSTSPATAAPSLIASPPAIEALPESLLPEVPAPTVVLAKPAPTTKNVNKSPQRNIPTPKSGIPTKGGATTTSPPSKSPTPARSTANMSSARIKPQNTGASNSSTSPIPIRTQHTGTGATSRSHHSPPSALRPQHTGASTASSSGAIRPQHTGTSTSSRTPIQATPLRSKTPSSRPKIPPPSTALHAPTASSLAKSRQAPVTPTPTGIRRPSSIISPSGRGPPPSSLPKSTSSLSVSQSEGRAKSVSPVGSSSSVPFPSARKAKTPSTGAHSARKTRMSHAGGGASAAALAARAAVAASTMPLPTSQSAPIMPSQIVQDDVTKEVVIVPPASPLTEAALEEHDSAAAGHTTATRGDGLEDAVKMLEIGGPSMSGVAVSDTAIIGTDILASEISGGVAVTEDVTEVSAEVEKAPPLLRAFSIQVQPATPLDATFSKPGEPLALPENDDELVGGRRDIDEIPDEA